MKSTELIVQLSSITGWSDEKVSSMLSGVTEAIKAYCSEVDSVAIPGFGTFVAQKTDEHVSPSPTHGQKMIYPPAITVNFKSSVVLRKKLIG